MRELSVYADATLVGTLQEDNNIWRFTYAASWLAADEGFDLSPALCRTAATHLDGSSVRPVQWYFDNLLPEEDLRLAIARDAGIADVQDAFSLLTYLGAESTGALTLLPPGTPLPNTRTASTLSPEQLSARIAELPRKTLTRQAPKRMSIAGAQHKLLVLLLGDEMYEPEGATPSTHILKPDHPLAQTYPASALNEYVTMRLAKAAQLDVPEVRLFYVPQPVYCIDRFDRPAEKTRRSAPLGEKLQAIHRLHIIDACQLLNKDRLFKHAGASLESLARIIEATTNKAQSRLNLFRWLVFNVLVGNDDAHLKNLSFFVSHEGIRLAPHYDLLCTGAYHTRAIADDNARWAAVPMTFELPGSVRTFGEVTRSALIAAGDVLGVPSRPASSIIHAVVTRVESAFVDILKERKAFREQAPASLAPYVAMEDRILRVIEHITLTDMFERLRT